MAEVISLIGSKKDKICDGERKERKSWKIEVSVLENKFKWSNFSNEKIKSFNAIRNWVKMMFKLELFVLMVSELFNNWILRDQFEARDD